MFLWKYFPPFMVTKLRNEITNFGQRPDESLFKAWERYKLSIDRCPNHNMLPVTQIDTLYNRLTLRHRDTINAAAGGTFMKRRPEECYDNAFQTLLPQIRAEIREEFRTGSGPSGFGGNLSPVTIHTWLERFNKQKPRSFEKAIALVDVKNWISHMEKIFDVMGCEDAFKTRLAVYKFEGDALAWWKAYKQAKGGDVWLITVTWAEFKELIFLQFFPRAEKERLKREYHSILQTDTETSTEFMQCFLRLAGFLRAAAGTAEEQAKNFQ
nr:zinc finger, CCHC-type, retrotransposon Gag domain protein [Tanacetum cinerariifolium]